MRDGGGGGAHYKISGDVPENWSAFHGGPLHNAGLGY